MRSPDRRYVQLLMAAACCVTAAGCAPVRDELFVFQPIAGRDASMTMPAPPNAGKAALPMSGPSGAAGSGTAAQPSAPTVGSSAPHPHLNPAITFDWTETIPGAGSCQAGKFTGNFSCDVDSILLPERFEGSITLVLKGSSEAQSLTIDAGQLLAFDENTKPVVSATHIVGTLNCVTQALSADVLPTKSEVMPAERQVAWLNAAQQPSTSGTLKGSLDPSAQTLQGDLQLLFDPSPTCTGTFSVRAAP
jgi:hypothetical protein